MNAADALSELSGRMRMDARHVSYSGRHTIFGYAAELDAIALRLYSKQPPPEARDDSHGKGTEQHGGDVNPSDTSMKSIDEVQRYAGLCMTVSPDRQDDTNMVTWVDYAALLQRAEAAEAKLEEAGKLPGIWRRRGDVMSCADDLEKRLNQPSTP